LTVNIRAGRALTAILIATLYTAATLGSIAITGTATPGKSRVNVGPVDTVAGMGTIAAMTEGAIDTTASATAVVGGGTVIVRQA
jgi:hypothetical protein